MPLYEYDCGSCQKRIEAIQKFADAPLTDCPECGAKAALQKRMSLNSFSLKGTGWYSTDYKKSTPSSGGAASGGTSSSSSSS